MGARRHDAHSHYLKHAMRTKRARTRSYIFELLPRTCFSVVGARRHDAQRDFLQRAMCGQRARKKFGMMIGALNLELPFGLER